MRIRFGFRDVEFPSADLGELRESQDLLDDVGALWQRLNEDGYLLLRRLIDRENVINARNVVLQHMQVQQALQPDTPLLQGVMPRGGKSVQMMGRKGIAHHPAVLAAVEHPALFALFEGLFAEPALTYSYKWLRGVGNEEYTGAHFDFVYMGRGSPNLYTVWIPFDDIEITRGALAICRGSHNLASFARIRDTYGKMDVDRDRIEGWFELDPPKIVERFGGQWLGSHYRAGDVIIFGMHTMHASTTNLTNRFRLSCDVRFQPASEPMDERWAKHGRGHYATVQRDMKSAREQWGL
ncbi:MAG: phytanoyl-CoA dioxygenase family protein [Chloroflexi bacterium]|nr:phytanoyl-CoA dioxygenase family protein [Chloroflexota bacterium]